MMTKKIFKPYMCVLVLQGEGGENGETMGGENLWRVKGEGRNAYREERVVEEPISLTLFSILYLLLIDEWSLHMHVVQKNDECCFVLVDSFAAICFLHHVYNYPFCFLGGMNPGHSQEAQIMVCALLTKVVIFGEETHRLSAVFLVYRYGV